MRFSVVIRCFNNGATLPTAIDSVLQQGRDDVEIIVGNDASTDGTPEVLARYGRHIRSFNNALNCGSGTTWAACIARAEGRAIVNLDADDWLLPGYFERAAAGFEAGAGAIVCSTYDYRIDSGEVTLRRVSKSDLLLPADAFRDRLLRRCFFRSPGMAWRRDLGTRRQPPRSDIWHDDYEYMLRVTRGQSAYLLGEPAAVYRIHDGSMSQTSSQQPEKVRDRLERFAALVRSPTEEAYLEPAERRIFAIGLSELYLRIVGSKLGPRNAAEVMGHIAFAVKLAASEHPALSARAMLKAAALARERLADRTFSSKPAVVEIASLEPRPWRDA
jgi:glycosyltransferase involved in cell wall biosynthesis